MAIEAQREQPSAGQELLERVEQLTAAIDAAADPFLRGTVDELVSAIIELYGEGLTRIVRELAEQGEEGLLLRLAGDGVIGSLLLIHDLYPIPLQDRVEEALASVRPYMESHGGDVQLLKLDDGVAHLALVGHCHGCPASAATLELAIKEALEEAAPDLLGLEVEGVAEPKPIRKPLAMAQPIAAPAGAPGWLPFEEAGAIDPGTFRAARARGRRPGRRERRRHRARLPRSLRGLRDVPAGGVARGPAADVQRLRTGVRPHARRPCGGRRGASRPRPAAAARRARLRGRARLMTGGAPPAVRRLRRLAQARPPAPPSAAAPSEDHCDLCGVSIDAEHRHLLHLVDRRILCSCEPCFAMRAGDAELRPAGTRVQLLGDFVLDDDLWAKFQIPIGLAFFLVRERGQGVVALYPSPAGATESELHLAAWDELVAANPVVSELEADVEALIVDRMSDPPRHAIVPIDRCYELVGMIKSRWEGISGGRAIDDAVAEFFGSLERQGA